MYWQGWRIARIAEELDVSVNTLHSWKRRDAWDNSTPIQRAASITEVRYIQLINKEPKGNADYKEIEALGREMTRQARIRRYETGGNETDLNPKVKNRNNVVRQPPERNIITDIQQRQLIARFNDEMFSFQRAWYSAGLKHRIRNVLKSRQIGATYYFAHEAFIDALTTGRNQIFLSASKAQAHQFKSYILAFAKSADVQLTGDPIRLPNGANLYFLGTSSRTAQSYHGNLYLDEYFWIPKFQELRKVASAMSSHKQWRQTYFSTPSSLTHDAYPFWSAELYNKGRKKADQIKLDISHSALKKGRLCHDGQWRQIVTLDDAMRGGCDLFDLQQLQLEYSPDDFNQLYRCQFIDDGKSVFNLAAMQRCMVDSWAIWTDFKPLAPRPYGYREVWVGYDPSNTGDSAGCVVVAPPQVPGGKFRVLERHQWRGMDFAAQAAAIEEITKRYNVTYIGIDASGLGAGVYQLVKNFYPAVDGFNYSIELKTRMVLKAYDVIKNDRLEFDSSWTDLAASFMAIKKVSTTSGRQVTYKAGRADEISHADLAWACMHALGNEPLEGSTATNSGFMETC